MIANRLEVDVTSPNEAYESVNQESVMEDYVQTTAAPYTPPESEYEIVNYVT